MIQPGWKQTFQCCYCRNMSFDTDLRRLRGPSELQALAHPLRLAILEHLTISGPMTASDLGDVLDETPANCSWHLRKLAEHDLVEETHDGRGRRRPWRAVSVGFTFSETGDDAATRIAGEALREELIRREVARFAHNASLDSDWDVSTANQGVMWATRQEAE